MWPSKDQFYVSCASAFADSHFAELATDYLLLTTVHSRSFLSGLEPYVTCLLMLFWRDCHPDVLDNSGMGEGFFHLSSPRANSQT